MTTTRLHTAEELFAMGSDAPYILIEGRLIEEVPCGRTSSKLGLRIGSALLVFSDANKLGEVYGADAGFILRRNPDTVLSPDAAYVRADRLAALGEIGNVFLPLAPDLVVEVLSPSDRAGEMARKVELYQRAGVSLIWVIDPESRQITVYAGEDAPRTVGDADTLDGAAVLPGFSLALSALFG